MQRSTPQPRRAAMLSRSLRGQLSTYALAASAASVGVLALCPPSEAQIVYTPAHETIVSGGKMLIDLNNDGVADLTLREFRCSAGTYFPANSLQVVPREGNGVILGFGAAALPPSAKIGPSL